MSDERPPTIDPVAAARCSRLPVNHSPWLHEEVARRMAERLQWIRAQPDAWAHWGPLAGGLDGHRLVQARYPQARAHLVETHAEHARLALTRLRARWWQPARWLGPALLCGEPPPASVQLVWSNMTLHAQPHPQALIARWSSALAPGGFVMFSCLGPDSLRDLRRVYESLGWPPPASDFTDMHDWGDLLVASGFAEPVMDMETLTLSWSGPEALLAELRQLGRNLHPQRWPALRARGWKSRLQGALASALADPAGSGRLLLRFEIVYGHAFKSEPRLPLAAETRIGLEELRRQLRCRD